MLGKFMTMLAATIFCHYFVCTCSELAQRDSWIGLRRHSDICSCAQVTDDECETCRGAWSWVDGTVMSWWNWVPNEPGISECGRLSTNGWAEYECSAKYRFICERGIDVH